MRSPERYTITGKLVGYVCGVSNPNLLSSYIDAPFQRVTTRVTVYDLQCNKCGLYVYPYINPLFD